MFACDSGHTSEAVSTGGLKRVRLVVGSQTFGDLEGCLFLPVNTEFGGLGWMRPTVGPTFMKAISTSAVKRSERDETQRLASLDAS